MPIQRTTSGGKPAYKYGETGKAYTYEPGNKASREAAKAKAAKYGRAVKANTAGQNTKRKKA